MIGNPEQSFRLSVPTVRRSTGNIRPDNIQKLTELRPSPSAR